MTRGKKAARRVQERSREALDRTGCCHSLRTRGSDSKNLNRPDFDGDPGPGRQLSLDPICDLTGPEHKIHHQYRRHLLAIEGHGQPGMGQAVSCFAQLEECTPNP